MNAENQQKIRAMLSEAFAPLSVARGHSNYEEAIAALREEFRDKATSPAAWLHRQAREMYPMVEGHSVNPEYFYEILGQVDTLDKLTHVIHATPDDQFHIFENFLRWLLSELLPAKREEAKAIVKHLPPYRRGGPKEKKMPSEAVCREIYDQIFEEYHRTGSIGEAQRNVALNRRLNLRMVQRIKAKYKSLLAENDTNLADQN